jgi:hypothetical protein
MRKQSTDDLNNGSTSGPPDLTAYGYEEPFVPEPESDPDTEFDAQAEPYDANLTELEIWNMETRRELGLPDPYEQRLEDLNKKARLAVSCGFVEAISDYACDGWERWLDFEYAARVFDELTVKRALDDASEEFRRRFPKQWQIYMRGDSTECEAVAEERRFHTSQPSEDDIDWHWVQEETALHRQGQCRFRDDITFANSRRISSDEPND